MPRREAGPGRVGQGRAGQGSAVLCRSLGAPSVLPPPAEEPAGGSGFWRNNKISLLGVTARRCGKKERAVTVLPLNGPDCRRAGLPAAGSAPLTAQSEPRYRRADCVKCLSASSERACAGSRGSLAPGRASGCQVTFVWEGAKPLSLRLR